MPQKFLGLVLGILFLIPIPSFGQEVAFRYVRTTSQIRLVSDAEAANRTGGIAPTIILRAGVEIAKASLIAVAEKAALAELEAIALSNAGRSGGPIHQRVIAAIERVFNAQGWKTIGGGANLPEVASKISSSGAYRYADLLLKKGDQILPVNVGKALKTMEGMPVWRERAALLDLLREHGRAIFVQYNNFK